MILNVKTASEFLGISPNSLRSLAKTGKIPAARIGRAWRFVQSDLEKYLRDQYAVTSTNEVEASAAVQ